MNYTEKEKLKRNIDLINIVIYVIAVIPILLASNFIANSFEKADSLTKQFEYFDELKTIHSEISVSEIKSDSLNLQSEKKKRIL